eukprot:4558957-Heterocapsa_arctica.AAC.1
MDKGLELQLSRFNKGLCLGSQNHSTGRLMRSPASILHNEGTSGVAENRHKKENLLFEANRISGNDQHCSR